MTARIRQQYDYESAGIDTSTAGKLEFARMAAETGCYVLAESVEADPEKCDDGLRVQRYQVGAV